MRDSIRRTWQEYRALWSLLTSLPLLPLLVMAWKSDIHEEEAELIDVE